MTSPAYRVLPGDRLGCFEVMRPLTGPEVPLRQQQFMVRTCCCGLELVRGYRALRDAARLERARCRRCADVASGFGKKTVGTGTRFGPVVVEAESGGRYWARWDCCGRVAEMSSSRLYVLRHEAKQGAAPVCRECYLQAKGATHKVKTPWCPAAAELPAGILSAAVAWPRPGAGTLIRAVAAA